MSKVSVFSWPWVTLMSFSFKTNWKMDRKFYSPLYTSFSALTILCVTSLTKTDSWSYVISVGSLDRLCLAQFWFHCLTRSMMDIVPSEYFHDNFCISCSSNINYFLTFKLYQSWSRISLVLLLSKMNWI